MADDEDAATMDAGTTRLAPGGRPGAPAPTKRLGSYPVRGVLGVGGMGQVLEVEDTSLGRVIAAKVILGQADAAARAKFVQEAQVTGQLEHPNIVPIYELSHARTGPLYYTMKRIQGQSLEALLARRGKPGGATLARLLSVFSKVCDAMAYAHDRGVIHRDLKPANIMVGQFGEVLVVDWGLAKLIGAGEVVETARVATRPHEGTSSTATLDGQIMGTPHYMPPEQAAGEIDKLDPRSDVYSLGAILYEIATGQRPFEGKSPWDVLDQVREGNLVPPTRRAPEAQIPWELEAVVLRAMAVLRAHRYAGAAELKADVEAFLEGRLLAAARYTLGQRVHKWAARHRAIVGTVGAALVTATVLGAMAVVRISREHDIAVANERGANIAAAKARASLAEAEAARAHVLLQAGLRDYARHIAETRMFFYVRTLDPVRKVAELQAKMAELERIAAHPDNAGHADAYSLLGVGWYHLSCAARAEAALLRAHALAPRDGWVNYYLGRIYAERSMLVLNSSTDLKRILKESDRWAREAGKYLEVDDPDLRDIDRHQLKVLRAMTSGHPEEARRLAEEGIATYDKVMGVEDFHAAIGYCAVSREQVVAILENRQDLASVMLAGKLVQAVIAGWTKAIEIRPHYAWAYYGRGFANLVIGQRDHALHDFGRAIQIAPAMPEGHGGMAVLHQGANRWDEAMAELDLAITLGPTNPLFRVQRAAAWLSRNEVQRAIDDYTAAIAADPSDVASLAGRAYHQMKRGDDAAAMADFTRLIEVDADNAWALNYRAGLREKAGDIAGALADHACAANAPPLRWEPVKRYGLALMRANRPDEARAALTRALELAPEKERSAIQRAIDELGR